MAPMVLDLGCGTAKTAGAIGLDVIPLSGVDLIGDMSERPFPFAANTFDAIYLNDVVEHLPNTIKTMEELYRIIKANGRIFIRVINWNSRYAAMDPTHVGYFTERTFDFFGKRVGRSYYTNARFDVVSVKRVYNAFAKAICPNERLLHFLGQYWSNVLDDLHFELRAVKPQASNELRSMPGAPHPWFASLRCPIALAQGGNGELARLGDWLVCAESGCKYPVKNGVPCLSRQHGLTFRDVAIADLPNPAPFPEVMPVEDKPIESIAEDDGFREISSVHEFAWEMTKACASLALRMVGWSVIHVASAIRRRATSTYYRVRMLIGRARRRAFSTKQPLGQPSDQATKHRRAA